MPEFEAIEDGVTGSFFIKDDVSDLANSIKYWILMSEDKFKKHKTMCTRIIKEKYNPMKQKEIFEKILYDENIN
jgi:hypothetical protein